MNRGQYRSLLVPALLVAVFILLALSLGSQTQIGQGPLSVVFAPVQRVLLSVGSGINNALSGPADLQTLRAENLLLQQQNARLSAENIRLRQFQAEVDAYRDLLKFSTENPGIKVIGADVVGPALSGCNSQADQRPIGLTCANVIAADSTPYLRFLTIDVGTLNGIRSGMPVVGDGLALIGRIGQASLGSSTVQLLNDTRSNVNVVVQGTRVSGSITGQPNGELVLQNIQQTNSLGVGDAVVTSGLGGGIPPGLPIGQIEAIVSSDAQLFRQARLRPAADYSRITIVLVITSTLVSPLIPESATCTCAVPDPRSAPGPTAKP